MNRFFNFYIDVLKHVYTRYVPSLRVGFADKATPVIARSEATKQPHQTCIRPTTYNSLSFNLSAFSATINWSMADWISPFIKADKL